MTPPLFHLNFGGVPVDHIAHVGVSQSRGEAVRTWNYLRSIPSCVKNIPQRHRQTDRLTDDRRVTTYSRIIAR